MICVKTDKEQVLEFISKYFSQINSIFLSNGGLIVEFKDEVEGIENYEKLDCKKLKRLTPKISDIIDGVRSYYTLGDILLISPKKEIDKKLLAQVILKINPRVKAVFIRKRVQSELRVNDLEFIGGEFKTSTIYRENGINFYVDISKVYVNPSLSNERLKTSNEIECEGKILDAFTGYGAYALYLLRKCMYVIAGDLNIEGLYLLKESLKLNKLRGYIDIVQYDAHYLPFRDKVFSITIADNPTMIVEFKNELCRVSRKVIFYILVESEEKAKQMLGGDRWFPVNDYSKNLRIFKGNIRCNNIDV